MPSEDNEKSASKILSMLVGHWAEVVTAILLGVLGFLGTDILSEFRKHTDLEQARFNELERRVRAGEISSEGNKYRIGSVEDDVKELKDAFNSITRMSQRSWKELDDYRQEKRKNFNR